MIIKHYCHYIFLCFILFTTVALGQSKREILCPGPCCPVPLGDPTVYYDSYYEFKIKQMFGMVEKKCGSDSYLAQWHLVKWELFNPLLEKNGLNNIYEVNKKKMSNDSNRIIIVVINKSKLCQSDTIKRTKAVKNICSD